MNLKRYYPKNYDSLSELVHLASRDAHTVVVQAGHFLLYYDEVEKKILPCIEEFLVEPRHADIRADYAQFPVLTWSLGLRLLASIPAHDKRAMVVVNDWQYLPKECKRSDFYMTQKQLPGCYAKELSRYSDSITLFEPKKVNSGISTAPFWSEMNLRNRYQRHFSKLITSGGLPKDAILEIQPDAVYCSFPDLAGVKREVYCSCQTGDCAGEIAEMLYESGLRAGATCFINIYPLVCREFVELGSQLSVDLLGSSCTTVLNIGVQSTAVRDNSHLIETAEASLHQ